MTDPLRFVRGGQAKPLSRELQLRLDGRLVVWDGQRTVLVQPAPADPVQLRALQHARAPPAPRAPRLPSEAARTLANAGESAGTTASPVDAGDGAIIVPVGRGADRDAVVAALGIARRDGRSLVFVDRSAEGFTSPYSDLRGDDAGRPSPERLFDAETARREGRNALADFLDAAQSSGLEAGAWYPTKAGADGLADAARRFGGAIVILPSDAAQPRLAERLRGMALDSLRTTVSIPVVVANQA